MVSTGWILAKIGEYGKAEELYQVLLEKASSNTDRGVYLNQLGVLYTNKGEYWKALSSHEQSLEISKVALPPNHPLLATYYSNISGVYLEHGRVLKSTFIF